MTFNKDSSEVLPLYTKNGINGNGPQISSKLSNTSANGHLANSKTTFKVFCFDLTQCSSQTQFLFCCAGVFALYLIYGYLQELIFTLDGFKPYGWFLTLIQFGYYTIFGYLERQLTEPHGHKRAIPLKTYNLLAFLTLGTMGLSNSSLGYLNYPTQVIFKCCKLVPVLIGSILIQKKWHGPLDFIAAIAMCVGLTAFTLGSFPPTQSCIENEINFPFFLQLIHKSRRISTRTAWAWYRRHYYSTQSSAMYRRRRCGNIRRPTLKSFSIHTESASCICSLSWRWPETWCPVWDFVPP